MKIFAGGSLPLASGITVVSRHVSVGFCAIAVISHNMMTATDSRQMPLGLVYLRFATFVLP
jgi:hypothetical protein